jgi:hypothetical protein
LYVSTTVCDGGNAALLQGSSHPTHLMQVLQSARSRAADEGKGKGKEELAAMILAALPPKQPRLFTAQPPDGLLPSELLEWLPTLDAGPSLKLDNLHAPDSRAVQELLPQARAALAQLRHWQGVSADEHQVQRAVQVGLACNSSASGSKAALLEMLAQARYEHALVAAEVAGLEFSSSMLQPQVHPATGRPHVYVEDPQHKGKCFWQSLRRQLQGKAPKPDVSPLLSLAAIQALIALTPSELDIVSRCLELTVGPQMCAAKDAVLTSTALADALRKTGQPRQAEVLEVLGAGLVLAWDMRGLTQAVRSEWQQRLKHMLLQLLMPRIKTVAGLQAGHVAMFPRDLLFTMMQNADAHQQLVSLHPCLAPHLHERALSQDDVEGVFSVLVRLAGWKPTAEAACRVLASAIALHAERLDPDRGYDLPRSVRSCYSYQELAAMGDSSWNSGDRLTSEADAEQRSELQRRAKHKLPAAVSARL